MQRVRLSSQRSPVQKLGDSQVSLSPKFKLSPTPDSENTRISSSTQLIFEQTIPGLPDDLALNCLLRLPVVAHAPCRAVCRRWRAVLSSKANFFSLRRQFNLRRSWLFVFAFHRCTSKLTWQVLDLHNLTWHSIPSMPCRARGTCPHGFGCVALPDGAALLVCGGLISDINCPLQLVLKYEIELNKWTVMSRMITPRSFFAAGVIDGTVYVAGGFSSDQFELDSAEAFNPCKNEWRRVANMGANLSSYDSAVLNGKLLVTEGWSWPFLFSPRGQVYDPKSNTWEAMKSGLREGWTGVSVVVEGTLFVISEHEKMRMKFYEAESDSWENVEGSPLPEKIRKPLSVSYNGCRIFVVGRGLHVAVGKMTRLSSKKQSFLIEWEVVEVPREFCDLTPTSSKVLFA